MNLKKAINRAGKQAFSAAETILVTVTYQHQSATLIHDDATGTESRKTLKKFKPSGFLVKFESKWIENKTAQPEDRKFIVETRKFSIVPRKSDIITDDVGVWSIEGIFTEQSGTITVFHLARP